MLENGTTECKGYKFVFPKMFLTISWKWELDRDRVSMNYHPRF